MDEYNDDRFDESSIRHPESAPAPAPAPRGPNGTLITVIVLLVCAVILSLAYTFNERKQASALAAKQEQTMSELQQTLDAMGALRARVDAMSARPAPAPQQAPTQLADSQSAGLQNAAAARTQRPRVRRKPRAVEDPRWAKMQKELTDQQQQLASTQQDLQDTRQQLSDNLQSTRDDLNGSIAKTHDELVTLEKKGERDYHEFDVSKSKAFQHVGPVGMELRKTNTKHDFYDVTLLVDDYKLDKKHVNLYEPVLIYPEDSNQPLELVVNHISKTSIHGYVSAPKYPETTRSAQNTGAETPAAAQPAPGASQTPATPSAGSSPGTGPSTGATPSDSASPAPKQE